MSRYGRGAGARGLTMVAAPRVDANALIEFATAVYAGAGMPESDARLVADTLVQADLWGHQSHAAKRIGNAV